MPSTQNEIDVFKDVSVGLDNMFHVPVISRKITEIKDMDLAEDLEMMFNDLLKLSDNQIKLELLIDLQIIAESMGRL